MIHSTRIDQEDALVELSAKVAQHVIQLRFFPGLSRSITIDLLCSFPNIQSIEISTSHIAQVHLIFKFAKRCKFLRKIKFSKIAFKPELVECLKQFLIYQANKNKRVNLKLSNMQKPTDEHQNWIFLLGKAIHGISGMDLDQKHTLPKDGQKWLRFYSQARHMKEIIFHNVKNVSTVLSDITAHAPPRQDISLSKLSMLYLFKVRIESKSLISLQHWRFRQVKHFRLYSVALGYQGTLLLAQHATFWPFVKTFILNSCKVTTNGLLHLLPAMVHRDGCKNLEFFDISRNKVQKQALRLIGTFLQSPNLKNMKIFHMAGAKFHHSCYTSSFINSLRLPLFIDLNLSCDYLDFTQQYNILHAIFSKPNPQLKRLIVGNSNWGLTFMPDLEQIYSNKF